MPIYTFKCNNCNKVSEELVPMSTTTSTCSTCNNIMSKIPSVSNFHLKGGGWFKDGYSKETVKK